MTTVSIMMEEELSRAVDNFVKLGIAGNRSEFIRRAVQLYVEEQAVQAVLKASKEPRLRGNLRDLAKKL